MRHLIFILSLWIGNGVCAEQFGISGGISTVGPTLEGTVQVNDPVSLRSVAIGGMTVSKSREVSLEGNPYDVDATADLGAFALLADYYPTSSGWRVSGGLFLDLSTVKADFSGAEDFGARLSFEPKAAPMITTGYKIGIGNNLSVSGEVGAIVANLTARSGSSNEAVIDEIDKLNRKISAVTPVPFASVSVGFAF